MFLQRPQLFSKKNVEIQKPVKMPTERTTSKKEKKAEPAQPTQSSQEMSIDLAQLIPDNDPRIIFFTGQVTEESIMSVIAQLTILASKSPVEPITLIISTYGGSVHEMFGLYDMIKWLPCPVHTVGVGKIMSAGVLLLAAGEKGNRMIGEHSRVMIHPMMAGSFGNIFELRNEMRELEAMQSDAERCLASETGRRLDEVKAMMEKGHDAYLTATEAIEFGIADEIFGKPTKLKVKG